MADAVDAGETPQPAPVYAGVLDPVEPVETAV
jgi:hypothetical protein